MKREKKRSVEGPPKVARLLKLVDEEEDLEAEQPVEIASVPILVPIEDSEVEVVEVEPAAIVNVANFLVARRK